jgi:hypothetical protein
MRLCDRFLSLFFLIFSHIWWGKSLIFLGGPPLHPPLQISKIQQEFEIELASSCSTRDHHRQLANPSRSIGNLITACLRCNAHICTYVYVCAVCTACAALQRSIFGVDALHRTYVLYIYLAASIARAPFFSFSSSYLYLYYRFYLDFV